MRWLSRTLSPSGGPSYPVEGPRGVSTYDSGQLEFPTGGQLLGRQLAVDDHWVYVLLLTKVGAGAV